MSNEEARMRQVEILNEYVFKIKDAGLYMINKGYRIDDGQWFEEMHAICEVLKDEFKDLSAMKVQ